MTQWTSADGNETLQNRYDGSSRLMGITAVDGAVTLTGPVKSEDEKKAVEGKAAGIAGAGKVTDQLTVPK